MEFWKTILTSPHRTEPNHTSPHHIRCVSISQHPTYLTSPYQTAPYHKMHKHLANTISEEKVLVRISHELENNPKVIVS